jgi:hypothetical protein
MSLHIEQREREGVVILDLKGPLTLGHGEIPSVRRQESPVIKVLLRPFLRSPANCSMAIRPRVERPHFGC